MTKTRYGIRFTKWKETRREIIPDDNKVKMCIPLTQCVSNFSNGFLHCLDLLFESKNYGFGCGNG